MDFGDLFWPRVTLTVDILTAKVDRFMPLPSGPLVPVCIIMDSFVLKISCAQIRQQTNKQMNG